MTTASKAKPREVNQKATHSLQAYTTSLLYLRQEAKRDGLEAVAGIMWNALAAIEDWLNTGQAPVDSRDLLDSSLCHSLDFMLKWLELPLARRLEVARDIARYEAGPSAALSPSRRRVSKLTAN